MRALFEILLYGVGVWHGYRWGHWHGVRNMTLLRLAERHPQRNDGLRGDDA